MSEEIRVPKNVVNVSVSSVTDGVLNQELVMREYSDDVAVHVTKNFAVTDGISNAFKALAKATGAMI